MKTATAIFVTLIILVMVNCSSADKETLQPSDLPAYMWMQSPKADRDAYVVGFLGGMNQTVRIFNKEIIFNRYIKYAEISEKIYMHLLAHPELRSGPIGLIILDALKGYMTIKDR
ncbi:MAG: hypothetical protein Q7O12_14240 [Deltaproteobacteria bacterium]|nr:hypothetical protein [Deltaproteobacteria bacterium]